MLTAGRHVHKRAMSARCHHVDHAMHDYLMLLHETPADQPTMSENELRALIQRYSDWAETLRQQGRLSAGHKLCDDGGRQLRRPGA